MAATWKMKRLAVNASVALICAALVTWAFWNIWSVRVDGSREDCQHKFPGRECMIVWVPKP